MKAKHSLRLFNYVRGLFPYAAQDSLQGRLCMVGPFYSLRPVAFCLRAWPANFGIASSRSSSASAISQHAVA